MKIFITGATGFLGKACVKSLLAGSDAQLQLFLLARSPLARELRDDRRVTCLAGDLNSLNSHSSTILDCDYVFHIAANADFSATAEAAEADNYQPTKVLTDILKSSPRLKNFVFISSIGSADRAPGDRCRKPLNRESRCSPRSAYGRSKLRGEEYIRASGVPATILRATWIYGEDMRLNSHISQFVSMLARGSKIGRLAFPGRVSLIHVQDLAAALARVPGNPRIVGKTYFAWTENLSIGEIFSTLSEKMFRARAKQLPVPRFAFFLSRLHAYLPLALSSLFLDYLCADEANFLTDFSVTKPIRLNEGIQDVLRTHAKWNGKHIITGANSGIGLALATQLDREGKALILVDRNLDRLAGFSRHQRFQTDLSDADAIRKLADALADEKITALINNAGVGYKRSIDSISQAEIFSTIDINMRAPVLLTKLLLPQLKRDQANIVNVGSSVAYNPLPGMSLYAASKGFVVLWSEALAYELRATNSVLTVSPSGTRTGFQGQAGVAVLNEGRGLQSPDAVAEQILKAMRADKRTLILGFSGKVLNTAAKFLPRSLNIRFWGALFASYR